MFWKHIYCQYDIEYQKEHGTGSYTDRDGNRRYTFDVLAENVEFCDSKQGGSGSGRTNSTPDAEVELPDDEDLPF